MNQPSPDIHLRQLIILGMFDLTKLDAAMAVRIHNLHQALQPFAPTCLLSGTRRVRHQAVLRFLRQGTLRQTAAIYVEASTSAANPTDLWFLWQAHRAGIPIIIFIPDGYQLFPDIFPRVGLKVKLLDWGWRFSWQIYQRVADCLLFPSAGLANSFHNRPPTALLPPGGLGGRSLTPLAWDPPIVTYVGGTSYRYGSDLLLDAMTQVAAAIPGVRCHFVTNEASYLDNHPARYAPWLTVAPVSFTELPQVMAKTTVTVIPLRQNPYNDLAVPVKLLDYMSFGRPIVATDCTETAQWVQASGCGLVVPDTPEAVAQGILQLIQNKALANQMGQAGYVAVQKEHTWENRAAALWQMIEAIEQKKQYANSSHS